MKPFARFCCGLVLVVMLLLAAAPPATSAGGSEDPERAKILERCKALLMLNDSFRAIEYMAKLGDEVTIAKRYVQLVDDLYWKEKTITYVLIVGRAGIQHILTTASRLEKQDPKQAATLRGYAKTLAYNLASYSWPGWDEPGIVIKPDYILVGFDAAKLNLRLALALNKNALKVSIAYWMLGAQQLALGQHDAAIQSFGLSMDKAAEAKAVAYGYLSLGFLGLSEILGGTPTGRHKLDKARKGLTALGGNDAAMFLKQLETAERVFKARSAETAD